MPEVRHLEISRPKGRRLAISDIHGCSKTFKALLKQIELTEDDHLYLLGDLINRGPRSAKVLKKVLKLQHSGYSIFLLRGNHEQIILDAHEKGGEKLLSTLKSSKSLDLLKDGNIPADYLKLLNESYHYFTLEDYYLVHAGFDFSKEMPFENTHAMMHIKKFEAKKQFLNDKKVVLGHSPQALATIIKSIKKGKRKLYIDNGCVNKKEKGQGNLVCLNLDTHALSLQPNID